MSLSHLKFRHLMLISLLVELGTLHKAAQRLSISQPAATGMLNDLEALLGAKLFVRGRQGMVPTDAAMMLLDRCRLLLNEFEEFTAAVSRVVQGDQPVLRIGVVPQAYVAYLPQAIDQFRRAGGCAIRTQEATASQLLEELVSGRLDCVIGRLPNGGSELSQAAQPLNFVKLYEERICVVAGPMHPLVYAKAPSFEVLAACDWVLQRPDSSVRRALAEAFLRKGWQLPKPVVETSSYIQNLSLLAGANLLTVAPRRAAEIQQSLGLVRIIDLELEVSPMQVGLISRASARSMPMLALFQACFVQSLEHQPAS